MTRPPADRPERLLASNPTDFERRVLEAAMQQRPSPAASARMARALGVSVAAVGAAASTTTLAAGAAASNATAASGTVWPWVSLGVIGLVVTGAVVGTRVRQPEGERRVVAPLVAPASPAPAPSPPAAVVAPPPARPVAPTPRVRPTPAAGDLGDQVAFLDSARAAMGGGASRRALEILRRYQDRYPTGIFRPEATAIKVEALMKLGRDGEARALALRFVADHRGTLLAKRVADVAGLTAP